jgi:hypothetical protein
VALVIGYAGNGEPVESVSVEFAGAVASLPRMYSNGLVAKRIPAKSKPDSHEQRA